jgi:hypothetical protein
MTSRDAKADNDKFLTPKSLVCKIGGGIGDETHPRFHRENEDETDGSE